MTHKTNITPGDWVALEQGLEVQSEEGGHEVHAYIGDQLVMIAHCSEGHFSEHYPRDWEGTRSPEYHLTVKEALANAIAIAAVPDLIAALVRCEQITATDSPLHIKIMAALKKAGVAL